MKKKQKKMRKLVLYLFLLSFISVSSQEISVNDKNALLALYNTTDGANWATPWDLNADPTTWYGVVTAVYFPSGGTGAERHIDEINLSNNNLVGTIPVELGNLKSLNKLDLSNNKITGTIPGVLGNANDLNYLYLQNNQLSGDIPVALFTLNERHFVEINLSYNKLTGTLPVEIGNSIANVGEVNVSNNLLTDLPDYTFVTLFRIKTLDISNNNLYFSVFGRVVSFNKIAKILEDNVDNLTYETQNPINNIEDVIILEGENTTLTTSGLTHVSNTYQWYYNNVIIAGATGMSYDIVNASLANSGNYTCKINNVDVPNLTVDRNVITVKVINERNSLIAIYNALDGANWTNTWDLNADISTWYGITLNSANRVVGIDLSRNNLSGELPDETWDFLMLEILNLTNNRFLAGTLSANIKYSTNLKKIDIVNTELSGNFPSEIFAITPLEILKIGDDFTGSLVGIENLINLKEISINESLFDILPEGFWLIPGLEKILIVTPASNLIAYNIPATINQLTSLISLNIHGNSSTALPAEITELPNLKTLSISGVITGEIPTNIGNLTKLDYLSLNGSNSSGLTGEIPTSITNLANLRVLSLNKNELTGEIPSQIGNLIKLTTIVLNNNKLSGAIPKSIGQLTNLKTAWLMDNEFSGVLPAEIAGCIALERLLLYNNKLEGNIPSTIGGLQSLDYLSLQNNKFTGTIPNSITSIATLEKLYLGSNNFSGVLPDFTVLNLNTLDIRNNSFVFEDFENMFSSYDANIASFRYSPQAYLDTEETISNTVGEEITFTVMGTQSSNNLYSWYKNNILIDGATESTYTISNVSSADIGEYTCRIANSIITDLILIKNKITLDVTLGEEDFKIAGIKAYPNPTKGNLVLSLGAISGENIIASVFELTGKLIIKQKNITDNQTLDLTSLKSGTYILKLTSNAKTYVSKIVKQ